MGTITGTSILNKAALQLTDVANTRWTRAELLGWLNDAQRQIVLMQPESSNKTASVKLSAGSRQAVPADGWLLLSLYRNMGTDGLTPGRIVRIVSRQLMDSFAPLWHASTPGPVAQNYVYDIQDQTTFFVYPPSDGTNYVEILYAFTPVDLVSEGSPIVLDDILETAILDYILYRACSKDAEFAPGKDLAAGYWTSFNAAVSAKSTSETTNDPNIGLGQRGSKDPGGES